MTEDDDGDVMSTLNSMRTDVTDQDGSGDDSNSEDERAQPPRGSRCCIFLSVLVLWACIGFVLFAAWQLKPLQRLLQHSFEKAELPSEVSVPMPFVLALLLPVIGFLVSCGALGVCCNGGGRAGAHAYQALGFAVISIVMSAFLFYKVPMQNHLGPPLLEKDVEAYKCFSLAVMLLGDALLFVALGTNAMRTPPPPSTEKKRALKFDTSHVRFQDEQTSPMESQAVPLSQASKEPIAAPMITMISPAETPMQAVEPRDLQRRFAVAVKLATQRITKERTSQQKRLLVYGLYKQATEGDSNEPQPLGKLPGSATMQRFDAWARYRGMSKQEAMLKYCVVIESDGV